MEGISSNGLDRLKLSQTENTVNQMSSKDLTQLKGQNDKLMEACQDFEAIFIKQMLSAMRKTVNKSDLIETSMNQEIFEDMLYDEYAKNMSRSGNLGMAKKMYDQLSANYIDPKDIISNQSFDV